MHKGYNANTPRNQSSQVCMCGEGTIQSLLETKAHKYVCIKSTMQTPRNQSSQVCMCGEGTIQTFLETKAHRYVCVVRLQYKHS